MRPNVVFGVVVVKTEKLLPMASEFPCFSQLLSSSLVPNFLHRTPSQKTVFQRSSNDHGEGTEHYVVESLAVCLPLSLMGLA